LNIICIYVYTYIKRRRGIETPNLRETERGGEREFFT
jgi:hypothetical protein